METIMAKAKTPQSMQGIRKKKAPEPAPPKKKPVDSAPHTQKGNPDGGKVSLVQLQVSREKRNEIKLFAATHGITIKDLMLMGFEQVKKSYQTK